MRAGGGGTPGRRRAAAAALLLAVGFALAEADFDRLERLAAERYGSGGAEAVSAWRHMLVESSGLPEAERLERVNGFFNRSTRFADDAELWGRKDYWATPLETLGRGAGDCEDFTIAKYATLRALGVEEGKLRLIYVRAVVGASRSVSQAHMVLGYYPDPTAEPLVLDNLIGEIRPASRRPDLVPVFSFNSAGLWVGSAAPVNDPTARLSRWRDLLARMGSEGFR